MKIDYKYFAYFFSDGMSQIAIDLFPLVWKIGEAEFGLELVHNHIQLSFGWVCGTVATIRHVEGSIFFIDKKQLGRMQTLISGQMFENLSFVIKSTPMRCS